MDTAKLNAARAAMETRRQELQADLVRLEGEMESLGIEQDLESGGVGNHLAEDGSSVTEQERIGTVSQDIQDVTRQIDSALERIANGTYSQCQRCGKPINEERLEAIPYVEFCIECQSLLERQRHLYGAVRV